MSLISPCQSTRGALGTVVSVHHLVGTAEIADMLGVSRQRVLQLAATAGFPKPVAELSAGTIWRRSDIEKWIAKTGREDRP